MSHGRRDRADIASFLVAVAAIAGPLALGGTGEWSRLGLEAAMAAVICLGFLPEAGTWQRSLTPLAVAAFACLQVLPLPAWVVSSISPLAAEIWGRGEPLSNAAWVPLSVDPGATAVGIRRLMLALTTVAAVARCADSVVFRRRTHLALAASCVVILGLALVGSLWSHDRVVLGVVDLRGEIDFWKTSVDPPVRTTGVGYREEVVLTHGRYVADAGTVGMTFGSYVTSNQFAAGMCLTMPFLLSAIAGLSGPARSAGIPVAIAGAIWVTGFLAESRAGVACLVLAVLVWLSLTLESQWLRRIVQAATAIWIMLLVGAAMVLTGVASGTGLGLLRPFERMILTDPRVIAARVAGVIWRSAPISGSGIDTYGSLFPKFHGESVVFYFAHNDWAQLCSETGLAGVGIAMLLGGWSIAKWKAFVASASGESRVAGAAPWASLAAIAAYSAFDWNLHVPANGFLASVVVGLAAATAPKAIDGTNTGEKRSPGRADVAAAGAVRVACMLAWLLLARDAASEHVQRGLRTAIVASRLTTQGMAPVETDQRLDVAMRLGEGMAVLDPSNARLANLLGQAYLHLADAAQPIDTTNEHLEAAQAWFDRVDILSPIKASFNGSRPAG